MLRSIEPRTGQWDRQNLREGKIAGMNGGQKTKQK